MLAVEQMQEHYSIPSDYVRCPACKKGRLCDKPLGEKVKVTPIKSDRMNWSGNRIILKCPKCAKKSAIYLMND